ncbi:nitroreductase [Verrucomicrobiales bacterium]|nr:nitroreductase [Verrucomicrobiales bacterium]MDC0276176.1 nitroreductase [Verrucomicrobiales bacterium]
MEELPTEDDPQPKLDPASLRMTAANALIRRRRTIKPADMQDKPVENLHLATILENANSAPTHGKTEPWRFTVFSGDGRQRVADFLPALYKKSTSEEDFRQDKFEKLGKQPLMAPVVIAICMKRQAIEKIPEIEEIEAVACAVQNMHLTASALGLAAFWSTPPIVYSDEMRIWLGLESEKDKCLGFFYLGWPREDFEWPESTRGGIAEKVTFIHN